MFKILSVRSTSATGVVLAVTIDLEGFANRLTNGAGWNGQRGSAEYVSAGSNYRTYPPTVSPRGDGGIFVSTKLDHIRGNLPDDHCIVEINFGPDGKIIDAKSSVTISGIIGIGDKTFDTGFIAAVAAQNPVAALALVIAQKLVSIIGAAADSGGRQNFPAIIQHNMNQLGASVKI